jgi:hypothetical protein
MTELERDELLARLDERVGMLIKDKDKYATCERVDAVANAAQHAYNKAALSQENLDKHVSSHQSMSVNRSMIAGSWATAVIGLVAAVVAYFKK